MKEKSEIVEQLKDMMADLHTEYHVKKIGIFGSFHGDANSPNSSAALFWQAM